MKKILSSLIMIVAVVTVVTGATAAYFTESATASTTFTTGVLSIDEGKVSQNFNFGTASVLAPGDSTGMASVIVKNDGNMNLSWFGYFNFTGSDEMLSKVYIKTMKMEFLYPDGVSQWTTTDQFITDGRGSGSWPTLFEQLATADPIKKISLKSFNSAANNMMGAGSGVFMGAIKPNFSYRLTFQLAMDEKAGNELQGQTVNTSFSVVATQVNVGAMNNLSDTRLAPNLGVHYDWMNTQIADQ